MDDPTTAEWEPPTSDTIKSFFSGLGLNNLHDPEAATAALPPSIKAALEHAGKSHASTDEFLSLIYRHPETIAMIVAQDLNAITAVAALLTALPPPGNTSTILDVGGGPGHLALWMRHCWPLSRVTVLDRVASSVALDWTPILMDGRISFVDGELPSNLAAIAGQQFERIVVARMLSQAAGHGDLRVFGRRALKALRPFVVDGGDLVIMDHFHGRDEQITKSLAASARKAGFADSVTGVRIGEHLPWQLRFATH